MQKHFGLKHWRMSAIVVLAALAVIASASQAFAQGQPGESNSYTQKQVANVNRNTFKAEGSLAEARNNGIIMDAWRANDLSNQVWMSYNDGPPFTIGKTETFATPAVVPFGPSNFLIFHTGTDGHIYWAAVSGTNMATGWQVIPGQTTNMAVSVAPIGRNSGLEYLVYRGSGDDTRVFGTFMNQNFQWSAPINLGGGLSVTPPAICLNNTGSSLWVATIGLDDLSTAWSS